MATSQQDIHRYIVDLFAKQDEALRYTQENTVRQGLPAISVHPEEGRFLQFLARASGARKAVEIGTLGGYSGIWIARGLAPGGRLITLEKEPRHAEAAREHFRMAGVAERVEVRVGNAHDLLPKLAVEGPFDFVFIDAEKPGYPAYFDWAMENLRTGGVLAAHNALRGGKVMDERETDEMTVAIREFNRRAAVEPRVISTIYPARDGTLVAVKVS